MKPETRYLLHPAIALSMMILASLVFAMTHAALIETFSRQSEGWHELALAQEDLALARSRVAYAQAAKALLDEASRTGFGPGQWASRRIDIRQASMSREGFNQLASQITRKPTQLFGADDFEISVKSPHGGLFDIPSGATDDQRLSVTLSGTIYFRLGAS